MARYNRNPNPAFDNNTVGWTTSNTKAALRRVATTRPDGVAGQIADARSNGTARVRISTTNSGGGLAPVVPGQTYVVSIYVYQGSGANQNVRLDVDQANSAGGYVSTAPNSPIVSVPNNTMTRIVETVTIPAGVAFLSTYVEFYTNADNTYVSVACAMVEDGASSPNYRDGNSTGWAWSAAGGNSPSQDLDPVAAAGADQSVVAGASVALSAAGSANPEGGTLTYAWSVLDAAGTGLTNAAIANRLTAAASFTAPAVTGAPAPVVLRLTVTDGNGNVGTDDVTVTVRAAALIDFTGSGGLVLGGAADAQYNRGNDIAPTGGLLVGGAGDVLRTLSDVASGAGGGALGGSALDDLLFITPTQLAGAGGVVAGGAIAPPLFITPTFVEPAGDVRGGGSALGDLLFITPRFVTGAGGVVVDAAALYRYRAASVPAAVKVEWDLDDDDDFSETLEDVTPFVVDIETQTGRDFASNLTGKAGPGRMKITLQNRDNRFSYFNAASPLQAAPFSLSIGQKIRLRTADSVPRDPRRTRLDSFDRAAAATLGATEVGAAPWSGSFSLLNGYAVPDLAGVDRVATVDAGTVAGAPLFVSAAIGNVDMRNPVANGKNNLAGVVFGYVDAANYWRFVYDPDGSNGFVYVRLVQRSGGVDTTRLTYGVGAVNPFLDGGGALLTSDKAWLAALVWTDGRAYVYVNGVLVGSVPMTTTSTRVGLFARWHTARARPRLDDFQVWDYIAARRTGVLWTGTVTNIEESVELGPQKFVEVEAEGPLAPLAGEITPPSSAHGGTAQHAIGNIIARAGLSTPGATMPPAGSTYPVGAFGYERESALDVARDFEMATFPNLMLRESQEGAIECAPTTDYATKASAAVFADNAGAQIGYHRIEPRDWRGAVFNRAVMGVASYVPDGSDIEITSNWANTQFDDRTVLPTVDNAGIYWIRPQDAATQINRGNLMLVTVTAAAMTSTDGTPGNVFWTPMGWTCLDGQRLDGTNQFPGRDEEVFTSRVFAKVADGTENYVQTFGFTRANASSAPFPYQNNGSPFDNVLRSPHITSLSVIRNFFGDVKDGIKLGEFAEYRTSGTGAQTSGFKPPTVFPDWGPEHPTYYATVLMAYVPNGSGAPLPVSGLSVEAPDGYYSQGDPMIRDRNGGNLGTERASCLVAWADRADANGVEAPSAWKATITTPNAVVRCVTIAVRGGTGNKQLGDTSSSVKDGFFTVSSEDKASQRKYRVTRTWDEDVNLAASPVQAKFRTDAIVAAAAQGRRIVAVSYWAATTVAHRTQAAARRVGDKITLAADEATGIGYSGDYIIESINHKITKGGRVWEVTYELSPADTY